MENPTGYTDGYIKQNDLNIFYRRYKADPEKAIMVIAHGPGEHSGRYVNVFERLVPKGITIYVPDFRGHGKSDGKREEARKPVLNDLEAWISSHI